MRAALAWLPQVLSVLSRRDVDDDVVSALEPVVSRIAEKFPQVTEHDLCPANTARAREAMELMSSQNTPVQTLYLASLPLKNGLLGRKNHSLNKILDRVDAVAQHAKVTPIECLRFTLGR